jgi:hypothetical protein
MEAHHEYYLVSMCRNGHCERSDGHQRRLPHACHLEAVYEYQLLSIAHAPEWTLRGLMATNAVCLMPAVWKLSMITSH